MLLGLPATVLDPQALLHLGHAPVGGAAVAWRAAQVGALEPLGPGLLHRSFKVSEPPACWT